MSRLDLLNTSIAREQFQLGELTNNFHHSCGSLNIIVGIDFTSSNEWKGRRTFNSQSLHKTLGNKIYNPYQKVISVLGLITSKMIQTNALYQTSHHHQYQHQQQQHHITTTSSLSSFVPIITSSSSSSSTIQPHQSPLKIHAFGFGDLLTTDRDVFSLFDPAYSADPFRGDNRSITSTNVDSLWVESFDEVLNRYIHLN